MPSGHSRTSMYYVRQTRFKTGFHNIARESEISSFRNDAFSQRPTTSSAQRPGLDTLISHRSLTMTFFLVTLMALLMLVRASLAGTAELEQLIAKMEGDVQALAQQVEMLYASRCTTSLEDCYRGSYEHCLSELPSPSCPASEQFIIEACSGCGALLDYSVSTVRLPREVADRQNGSPSDPQVRVNEHRFS